MDSTDGPQGGCQCDALSCSHVSGRNPPVAAGLREVFDTRYKCLEKAAFGLVDVAQCEDLEVHGFRLSRSLCNVGDVSGIEDGKFAWIEQMAKNWGVAYV